MSFPLPRQVLIAVMGITGVGKTYFISKATGQDLALGNSLESSTREIQQYELHFKDSNITLLDTPGFDDRQKLDMDLLEEFVEHLQRLSANNISLAGIIYLHRINDNRMQGSAQKNLHLLTEMCGDSFLKHVVLVTTMWDCIEEKTGIAREETLKTKFWKPLIDNGARVERFRGDNRSALKTIERSMRKMPADGVVLEVLRETRSQIPVFLTKAGRVLMEDKYKKLQQLHDQLDSLRETYTELKEKRNWEMDEEEMKQILLEIGEVEREKDKLLRVLERYRSDPSRVAAARLENTPWDSSAETQTLPTGFDHPKPSFHPGGAPSPNIPSISCRRHSAAFPSEGAYVSPQQSTYYGEQLSSSDELGSTMQVRRNEITAQRSASTPPIHPHPSLHLENATLEQLFAPQIDPFMTNQASYPSYPSHSSTSDSQITRDYDPHNTQTPRYDHSYQ